MIFESVCHRHADMYSLGIPLFGKSRTIECVPCRTFFLGKTLFIGWFQELLKNVVFAAGYCLFEIFCLILYDNLQGYSIVW